jgi:hypothetical protein
VSVYWTGLFPEVINAFSTSRVLAVLLRKNYTHSCMLSIINALKLATDWIIQYDLNTTQNRFLSINSKILPRLEPRTTFVFVDLVPVIWSTKTNFFLLQFCSAYFSSKPRRELWGYDIYFCHFLSETNNIYLGIDFLSLLAAATETALTETQTFTAYQSLYLPLFSP